MPVDETSINKSTEATLRIPFESQHHAEIAFKVLSVDQEPRRNFVTKEISIKEKYLEVHFVADQVKNLRTAITSFFESLLLCSDTIKAFDLDAGTHAGANTA